VAEKKKQKPKAKAKKPSVDVKEQVALGAEVPPKPDITREVFRLISQSADALHEKGEKRGALIVIGRFASIGQVKGARQLPLPGGTPNPFEGQYLSAGDKVFQRMLLQDEILGDGAVVVDASGQVLGGRLYLLIDHPELEIPEGCATRHLAAASTSLRRDVESVITLSEETNVARVFRNGRVTRTHDPAAAKQKRARKKKSDTIRQGKGGDGQGTTQVRRKGGAEAKAKKPGSGRRRKSGDTKAAGEAAGKGGPKREPVAAGGDAEGKGDSA
jgi:DNA integrity scanning protein DisA with diadenylate cyclase activity